MWLRKLTAIMARPSAWFILALLVLISLLHYKEALAQPLVIARWLSDIGLTRHAYERILYLGPIAWAGLLFGWRGACFVSLVALAAMLPRAILISSDLLDAVFETSAVFVTGNILAVSFSALRKEREYRTRLEVTQRELRTSEERYRQIFENAHDAIWLHDLEGNIIAANRASTTMTGYSVEELSGKNVGEFLAEDKLSLARTIRRKLLESESVEPIYEQHITKKDGSESILALTTGLIKQDGRPVAFLNIARDVTEERRLQEDLLFYLRQVTRAQEEERKRISRELHDDTIQALVVLSRQLDTIASSGKELSEESQSRLEELIQQTSNIMQGVRRLSQDLRPATLDRLGVLSALEWLASDVMEYSGVETKINVIGTEHRLAEEVELVLFRIAQEALRNVWRHAEATQAEITAEFSEGTTRITVSDNGTGFSPPETIGGLAKYGKLGLAGMQERASLIGGTLTVKSQPGKGTSVTIELPA